MRQVSDVYGEIFVGVMSTSWDASPVVVCEHLSVAEALILWPNPLRVLRSRHFGDERYRAGLHGIHGKS